MKKIVFIVVLFLTTSVFSQDFLSELGTSMERSEGGIGVTVLYKVHMSNTTVKVFKASEFDTGVIVEKNGIPMFYELTKKKGEEKEEVLINLQKTSYMGFKIFYVKGNCNYQFDFYY
jgi:hypothetical protein